MRLVGERPAQLPASTLLQLLAFDLHVVFPQFLAPLVRCLAHTLPLSGLSISPRPGVPYRTRRSPTTRIFQLPHSTSTRLLGRSRSRPQHCKIHNWCPVRGGIASSRIASM